MKPSATKNVITSLYFIPGTFDSVFALSHLKYSILATFLTSDNIQDKTHEAK